jgi:Sec-independent protein translocase protein TatA
MRASFEKVKGQMQELSGLLIKVQSEALSVLNACAAANMEALKGLGPDAAAMHKTASDAVEQASAQAAAAVGELKKRMNDLEEATRAAANEAPAAEPPAAKAPPSPKEQPAAKAAPPKSQPKPAAARPRPSSGSRKS